MTVSTYLLWLTAALALLSGVLTVSMVGRQTDALGDLYAGTAAEGTEGFVVGVSVFAVVLSVLFAAGLAILGIFNNRGRNGARITTWVLGGISLCCTGVGLAGTALTSSMNLDSSTGADTGPSATEAQAALERALPSWYEALTNVLTVISLLAILGAVILLALPASNAFFRKVAPAWDPAQQQFPYPGQPSYPQYPQQGQPQPGQPQPGQPQYPPAGGGLPPYPGQSPPESAPPSGQPSGPPAPGDKPPTDPWGRPAEDDKRPPTDPA